MGEKRFVVALKRPFFSGFLVPRRSPGNPPLEAMPLVKSQAMPDRNEFPGIAWELVR